MIKYIAFEGIDGSGKTTQVDILVSSLREKGINALAYRYTGKNNFFGRIIRGLYSRKRNSDEINPVFRLSKLRFIQEFLYAQSARLNHCRIKNELPKSLEVLVVCDRCALTSYASHSDRLPGWYITLLEPNIIPDIVFLLDINVETAIDRTKGREFVNSDECFAYEQKMRDIYLSFANGYCPPCFRQSKFIVINGEQQIEKVAIDVFNKMKGSFLDKTKEVEFNSEVGFSEVKFSKGGCFNIK